MLEQNISVFQGQGNLFISKDLFVIRTACMERFRANDRLKAERNANAKKSGGKVEPLSTKR